MNQHSDILRIGQFTDTFLPIVDGVGRVVHAYATELAALHHEVTVITPLSNTGHRGGLPYELVDYLGYPVPTSPQYRTGTPFNDPHYRKRIAMIPLDVVHAHGPFGAGREALRLSRRRGIPLVASFHSKYYDDFYKATRSDAIARIVVSTIVSFYEKCDDVWAVSEPTGEVLRGYGYKGPLRIMPNGVSPRRADPEAVRALEAQYHLADVPVLLFVGQMNWKKNLLRILDAAALLKAGGQPFCLLMAGMGPDMAAIKEKAEALRIGDQTLLLGHVADAKVLDALYARADLFVFPSLYDNAPMVVREAAVLGTPSVLVAGSDAAEIIRDRENGFLCRDDAEDLCRVIREALADSAGTLRIGKAALESIPVPWPSIMPQVVEGYRRCMRDHRPKGRVRRLREPAHQ
ncbi:MAG: glycosyltransferase [Christensenellales bacterium]